MVHILDGAFVRGLQGRERAVAGRRPAFDEAGAWVGSVSPCGAVYDADDVQIGVAWPNGEIVDFHGTRIGKA